MRALEVTGLSPLAKLALILAARDADDDGWAELSFSGLARDMGGHLVTARRALSAAEEAGWLAVDKAPGRKTRVRVLRAGLPKPRDESASRGEPPRDEIARPDRAIPPLSYSPPFQNERVSSPLSLSPTNEGSQARDESAGLGIREEEMPKEMREGRRALSARLEPVAARLIRLCDGGHRGLVATEACDWVAWAAHYCDAELMAEAIGYAEEWESRPHLPRALSGTMMKLASNHQIAMERFEPRAAKGGPIRRVEPDDFLP